MKNSPSRLVLALCAAFASTTVCAADAPYPEKAVRMIVPFAPGGPTDVIARVVAARLSEAWNHQVVVDNRAGAGGNIGMGLAATAPADGYTIAVVSSSYVVNPTLYAKIPYDPYKSFVPVTNIAASPNVFVASADLANPSRRTDTNPFQQDYAWGKAELINFTSTVGRPLQGILYYPANYDATKKYPMIVYTYELLSQGLHRYIVPRENDYYNANVFTQNGYFVLMPDIVFRPRQPGVDVLASVEPAIRSVIARGLVDPANIGHCGHSQGGYEAYYLATHSALIKTAVAEIGRAHV